MKIKSLSLEGFKNHKELKRYEFGDHTIIKGENFTGKTTICEAIVWAFVGSNLNGNDKADSLLQNNESKSMYVEVEFVDNDGTAHTLQRDRQKQTAIFLDEKKATQADLFQFIGTKDMFLSVMVPGYFESMSPKEGRTFMMDLLPPVDLDSVAEKLDEKYRKNLIKHKLLNANMYLTEKRAELKELESKETFQLGQKEVVIQNTKMIIGEIRQFDDSHISELEVKKLQLLSNKPQLKDTTDLKIKLREIDSQRPTLKESLALTMKKDELKKDYDRLKADIRQLNVKSGDICPSCKQVISEEHVHNLQSDISKHNEDIKVKIDSVINEGFKFKEQIESIINENEQVEAMFEENKRVQMAEIEDQIRNIENENRVIEIEFNNLVQSELAEINAKLQSLRQEQQEVVRNNAEVQANQQSIEKAKKQLVEIDEELASIKFEKENLAMIIEATTKFNALRAEMQMENIAKFMNRVTVRLEKFIKSSGEVKECFEVLYDNKEVVLLSNSERIRMWLEIANLINGVTGLQIPVYIDNAESVTHYSKPTVQIIETIVVKDQELLVEVA